MAFVKAGSSLARTFKKYKFTERERISSLWGKILKSQSKHAKLLSLENGLLRVSVDSSVYMQEFTFKKEEWKKIMNQKLGKQEIKDIHFIMRSNV